jgi:hypothetical protein
MLFKTDWRWNRAPDPWHPSVIKNDRNGIPVWCSSFCGYFSNIDKLLIEVSHQNYKNSK